MSLLKTPSDTSRASRAPDQAPARAAATHTPACRQGMLPPLASRPAARAVPMPELSLLVPMAKWTGSPAIM